MGKEIKNLPAPFCHQTSQPMLNMRRTWAIHIQCSQKSEVPMVHNTICEGPTFS